MIDLRKRVLNVKFKDGRGFVDICSFFTKRELEIFSKFPKDFTFKLYVREKNKGAKDVKPFELKITDGTFETSRLRAGATYSFKMRLWYNKTGMLSNEVVVTLPPFGKDFLWVGVDIYSEVLTTVKGNPRIATNDTAGYKAFIGNLALPRKKIVSWNIRILSYKANKFCIGVITYNVIEFDFRHENRGWYFGYHDMSLQKGCLHRCRYLGTVYRLKRESYPKEITFVTVEVNSVLKTISFVLNGTERLNNAFTDVRFDEPLVPCVIMSENGSAEFEAGDASD